MATSFHVTRITSSCQYQTIITARTLFLGVLDVWDHSTLPTLATSYNFATRNSFLRSDFVCHSPSHQYGRPKHRTYLWLHLSFDQYFFRQLSHPPQPPYQIHRQLHLSWPPPPVSQIHTQTAQTHSSLITYPPCSSPDDLTTLYKYKHKRTKHILLFLACR
jgi:hypothetical protein